MGSSLLRRVLVVSVILVVPVVAFAQEAALTGIVTDATMAVLPGVTIKAVHAASGNTFEAVTDQRGAYRIPVRVGVYKITATLSGFSTVTRDGVELLVGQTTTINLQMATGGVAESLTVTAQAPLIETTHLEPRDQHRSAAGDGAAVAGPQLDVARAAGARQPDERAGRDARAGPG